MGSPHLFGIILQLFRSDFTTCPRSRTMMRGFQRAMKRNPTEDIMSAKAVVRMPGEGKQVSLAGKPLVFLVTGQDTRHTSMFDWTLPAGFSTGTHVHRVQEETFYVLEGECEWTVGGELIRAKPGTYVFIPPGVPHNIANASDKPARMIMTVSPPGHEQYFEELVKLVTPGGPPDAVAIAKLRARFDTEQVSALKAS
jgi:quercetin dioxygenase-like cupin family protein